MAKRNADGSAREASMGDDYELNKKYRCSISATVAACGVDSATNAEGRLPLAQVFAPERRPRGSA